MSISRQRIEDIAKVYDIPVSSARLSRQVTYRIHDQAIRVRYDVAGHFWAAWHDRADGSTRAVWGGVASVVSLMVELAERGWTEPTTSPAEEIIQAEEIAQAAAYAEAPASAPGRGVDAFDEIERSDAAAAEFERMPRR